jgi:hypothetical protein
MTDRANVGTRLCLIEHGMRRKGGKYIGFIGHLLGAPLTPHAILDDAVQACSSIVIFVMSSQGMIVQGTSDIDPCSCSHASQLS